MNHVCSDWLISQSKFTYSTLAWNAKVIRQKSDHGFSVIDFTFILH